MKVGCFVLEQYCPALCIPRWGIFYFPHKIATCLSLFPRHPYQVNCDPSDRKVSIAKWWQAIPTKDQLKDKNTCLIYVDVLSIKNVTQSCKGIQKM